MRIRRPVLYVVKLATQASLKKLTFTLGSLTLIAAIGITLQNISIIPNASATPVPESCFIYTTSANKVTITGYRSSQTNPACSRDVEIPATIAGNSVTSIGGYAFSGNQLTSVTIPSSVTSIGGSAFSGNQLTSVSIPDGVTYIGGSAFSGNQLTSVSIPDGVTYIGGFTFSYNQLTSVSIPDSVTSIDWYAFSGNQLTSVSIPDSVTSISEGAFSLNRLKEVEIPNSVTVIETGAFMLQNEWGRQIQDDHNPSIPYIWSDDSAEVQRAYDSIWYVRLYTVDPANPQHIVSDATAERSWSGNDNNANDTEADSLGGHIANPARVKITAKSTSGTSLQPDSIVTGRTLSSTLMRDYMVSTTAIPAPLDPWNPTQSELDAMATGFNQYYYLGQTVTITAPEIPGYRLISPASSHTLTLNSPQTLAAFTYEPIKSTQPQQPSTEPSTPSTLKTNTPARVTPTTKPTSAVAAADKVDFAAEPGTVHNPNNAVVPRDVSPILAASTFALDPTSGCRTISAASLLSPKGFAGTSPEDSRVLGGLNFTLECAAASESAKVSFTLAPDSDINLSTMKIFKQTASGTVSDITDQVTSSRDGSRTVLSYSLVDGGLLDDDGIANGVIVDPIYLVTTTAPEDSQGTPVAKTDTAHTATDDNRALQALPWPIVLGVGLLLVGGTVTGLFIANKRRAK